MADLDRWRIGRIADPDVLSRMRFSACGREATRVHKSIFVITKLFGGHKKNPKRMKAWGC
jgi:hypothetical protein